MLVAVALLIAGALSVLSIPKESAPEVEVPVAIIATTLRGASAEDIAELVTKEIEKEVATVDNLDTLSSSSREGISIITAEFEASADIDASIQDVKDAVDRAKAALPRDADEPTVTRVNFADQPVLIISLAGGLPPAEFTELAKDVEEELERVVGVSRVDISGARERQTQVIVERETLSALGISLTEVVGALQSGNAAVPIGSLTVDGIVYPVQFQGDLSDPEQVGGIAVAKRGGRDIYIRDIAEVVNGIAPETSISRVSIGGSPAEPAITLNVYKKPGGDVTQTTRAVEERLEELRDSLLAGITPLTVYDTGDEVQDDLTELTTVGFETVVLVMLCLVLTIGWRESTVAGLSIPLSFVIAFIGLWASGNTINFVSLFSLILAIGILVDSGIVVTEAIHTRFKRSGDKMFAATETIREYAWPLTAGTMTTVAVFAPLFFISGITGEFIASIPFTIIFVLIASIFVALGLVPLLALMLTRAHMSPLEETQERMNMRVQTWYRAWLTRLLANRSAQGWFLAAVGVAFVFALALPVTGAVKVIFFPGEDLGLVYVEIEEKGGTPLANTDLATRAVEELLYDDPAIESFVTTVGASSAFSAAGSTGGGTYANITITLVPKEDRDESSVEFVERLREEARQFSTFTVRAYEPQNGPPTGAPVLVTFSGDNRDDLERAVSDAERVLSATPGATEVTTSIKDSGAQFTLTIDRGKAAEVGLSPSVVAQTVRAAVAGVVGTTIATTEDDIDVVVSANLNPNWRDPSETTDATIDALLNFSIPTPEGNVLLGSIVDVALEKSNALITREDQNNITTLSGYLEPGATAPEVSADFKKRMGAVELPEGVTMKVGGETEEVDRSFIEMFYALIAGMVLMLAILVLEFNSFRYALYLLMLVPLSLIGVFGGLALTGQPLSFPSLLGVIALAGVIINHAIILMDSMLVRMKEPAGRTHAEVVVDAAASRLRPIFLTTITTVVGMIPLARASSLWGPLAFTIMFGLAFAMILTLVLTPIIVYRWPGKHPVE